MSNSEEFNALIQYALPKPLDERGCRDVLEYVVQQLSGEARYHGEFSGILGNRFAASDEPFRREERRESFHVMLYFPIATSPETVQIEFLRHHFDRNDFFTALRFDVGLVDRLDEMSEPQQAIIHCVRGVIDTYLKYLEQRED